MSRFAALAIDATTTYLVTGDWLRCCGVVLLFVLQIVPTRDDFCYLSSNRPTHVRLVAIIAWVPSSRGRLPEREPIPMIPTPSSVRVSPQFRRSLNAPGSGCGVFHDDNMKRTRVETRSSSRENERKRRVAWLPHLSLPPIKSHPFFTINWWSVRVVRWSGGRVFEWSSGLCWLSSTLSSII
jgi:hypothetical protein